MELKDVRRLNVKPGEAVVIRLAEEPTPEAWQAMVDDLTRVLPDVRFLVVGPSADLEVVATP